MVCPYEVPATLLSSVAQLLLLIHRYVGALLSVCGMFSSANFISWSFLCFSSLACSIAADILSFLSWFIEVIIVAIAFCNSAIGSAGTSASGETADVIDNG